MSYGALTCDEYTNISLSHYFLAISTIIFRTCNSFVCNAFVPDGSWSISMKTSPWHYFGPNYINGCQVGCNMLSNEIFSVF